MYNVQDIKFENRDEYTRINIAENIYNNIKKSSFYSPCLLDGQWGSGKTEFCHKLYHYTIKQNTPENKESSNVPFVLTPIYINVFNAERINNPFLTLMGGIVGSIAPADSESLSEIASNILKTEVSLKPIGIAAAKDVTNFLLGKIKEYAPSTTEAVTQQITESIEIGLDNDVFKNAFKEVNKLDQQYNEFSTALEAFATPTQPLLFIVDELDRCRPDFAVQFLECIKHFFNVKNVYFLLSCNVDQLLASIEHLYGSKINSENYLEKFFEDKITLQNNIKNQDANIKILSSFVDFPFLNYHNKSIIDFIFSSVTLRGQEKVHRKYIQIKQAITNDQRINQFIYNQLDSNYGEYKLSDIVIFSFAYTIAHDQVKNISLELLTETNIFQTLLKSYCVNISGGIQRNDGEMQKAMELFIKDIKYTEKFFNQIISSIIYTKI